jgi:hypothetical protein
MELIGLLLAVPVTFVTSLAYAALILAAFKFRPVAGRALVAGSPIVVTLIAVELVLIATMGAKGTYANLGHRFTTMHFLGFFLGPPAVANLVLYCASRLNLKQWSRLVCATLCCWVACMAALLAHIAVDEAIVGIEAGKPFYMTPPGGPNKNAARHSPRAFRFLALTRSAALGFVGDPFTVFLTGNIGLDSRWRW